MGASELVLDQQVRDWVFIPLTISIVLMKLVMQYLHQVSLEQRQLCWFAACCVRHNCRAPECNFTCSMA